MAADPASEAGVASEDWLELRELLDLAIDLSSAQREVWFRTEVPTEHRAALRPLLDALESEETLAPSVAPGDSGARGQDWDPEDKVSWLGNSVAEVAPELLREALAPRVSHSLIGADLGPYRIVELIAEGGMSEVYRARRADGQFDLDVAIKVLHRAMQEPEALARFARERQILMELRHENLCRIFDGGLSADQRPYVVLELVEGCSITEHVRRYALPLRQRLELFLQALDAVQFAHQNGVIHRDLKPSNILVERSGGGGQERLPESRSVEPVACSQGELQSRSGRAAEPLAADGDAEVSSSADRVVVVDFGIARPADGSDLTRTGISLGTPGYLAPELLTTSEDGDGGLLRPSSDVFSMGAVLFEVLCERPPFAPGVLRDGIGDAEPPRLDLAAAGLSQETIDAAQLELVVHQSLRPDPSRRYDSIDGFRRDLRRALGGQVVEARPTSTFTRMLRRVRRSSQRLLLMAAVLLVLALVAQGLRNRRAGRAERARLTELTAQVEQLDAQARTVRMLPIHDVRSDRQRLLARFAQLEGELALGEGGVERYALGRAALSLRDYQRARGEFEAALVDGYDSPAVHLGLGRALLEIYRVELETTRRLEDPRVRARRIQDLRAALLEPAVAHLQAGSTAGSGPFLHPDLTAAWVRYSLDDLAGARSLAESVAESFPELYEARLLLGNLSRELFEQRLEDGDFQGAEAAWQDSAGQYEQALAVGRSDPQAWLDRCRLWSLRIDLANRVGTGGVALYQEGEPACQRGLTVDPEEVDFLSLQARAAQGWGEALSLAGEPRVPAYEVQLQLADQALARAPLNEQANEIAGAAHMLLFSNQLQGSSDSHFEPSRMHLERVLEINPASAPAMGSLALLWFYRGLYDWPRQVDPMPAFREADGWAQRALEQRPEMVRLWADHALVLQQTAAYLRNSGQDPTEAIERGIAAGERAVALDPAFSNALISLSDGYFFAGEFAYDCRDLERSWDYLEKAKARLFEAIERFPGSTAYRTVGAKHFLMRARVAALRAGNPLVEVQAGLDFLEPAVRGQHPLAPLFEGALYAVAAELTPGDFDLWMERARSKVEQFRREQPESPAIHWLTEQLDRAVRGREPVPCHAGD